MYTLVYLRTGRHYRNINIARRMVMVEEAPAHEYECTTACNNNNSTHATGTVYVYI